MCVVEAMAAPRRIGVILAAGRGRRMGRTKQLVPWPGTGGPKPLVAAAFDAICGGCDSMIVVLGHEAQAVAAALGGRPFRGIPSDPDAPMMDSIRAGLNAAREIDANAVVVLQPGDQPEVSAGTLSTLADWSLRRPAQAIIPEYRDRGGHPVFIPPAVAARILKADCPTGLGDFWRAHPDLCVRVALEDPDICRDVDVPADLRE
jgi:molybdenum cofactor cytidylyltransferase